MNVILDILAIAIAVNILLFAPLFILGLRRWWIRREFV